MRRILGIDTSNYTTSAAVIEDREIVYDARIPLKVKMGERGLRQSEALFQHVVNLPLVLNDSHVRKPDGVCVSVSPRPVEDSYMPVFKAGESTAESISLALGVPLFKTSHQEGHIEAALKSRKLEFERFYALHISGGTTELLRVKKGPRYEIEIIGGSKDISMGQFLDRIGVAMGLPFPAGGALDEMAVENTGSKLRIPSKTEGLYMHFSGQETAGLKFIKDGYNHEEIAYGALLCAAKSLDKVFRVLFEYEKLPLLITGGVASSRFMRNYFNERYNNLIFFSEAHYASDNAVGVAAIGYKMLER